MRGLTVILLLLLSSVSWVTGQTETPQNFDVALDGTVLSASWDAPEDENVISYTLNCSVDGEDVLSLETTLLEVSVGVYRTSTTYSCTVYATTSNGDGTPTDAMSVTTGDSSVEAYLPFIPRLSDENILTTGDDFSTSVTIVNFPFGSTSFSGLHVSTNGIISFGSANSDYLNEAFTSSFTGQYLVAPFWDDINISNGGTISYETFESGYYLEMVNAYIQRKLPTNFEGTWMMNVYYKEVRPFSGTGENTFQAILITDETQSYVVFIYMCGLMEWDNTATIGYTANGDSFDNHDPSSNEIACVNGPDSDWSNVIYLLSEDDTEANQPPEDLTATDITSTSVKIGWRVERIIETQSYVVNYGTSEDSLDSTSATVQSVTDISTVNATYNVDLTDLDSGTTYYYQVVATLEDFTLESDIASFSTPELAPSGEPMNFAATLEDTVLSFTWDPPAEDEQNGEIVSYFLSCSIDGEVELELNLTADIEEITVGVYEADSIYTCEIYASTSVGGGPAASQTITTSDSSTSEYLPFIPLGVIYEESNQLFLPQQDDIASSAISIPVDFPFDTLVQTTFYVGSNGIISFGTSAYNPTTNSAFPGSTGRYLIAPYWDDINISRGGTISYESFESSYLLEQVNDFLQRKGLTDFEGTWMMVVYYDSVQPFTGTGENTFQAVMITDETYTLTIFTYKCGLMDWDTGATIGYSAGGDPYDNHDPSSRSVACVNSPNSDWSNVVYLLSEQPTPRDVAAEVGTDTAFISWNVSDFVITQLEFTVYYGTEEDSLDMTSDTVTSSDDTTEYSVRLSDLSLGVTYYFKVVTTFSDFTLESDVDDFTTEELAPSGSPEDFTATLDGTVLFLEWAPPTENRRNGVIVSYNLSCSINSNQVFELSLKATVEEIYLGIYRHESTYSCDISAATSAGNGPTATVSVMTGAYSTEAYLPYIPLGILYENSNAINLTVADDISSSRITLPTDFPFADSTQTSAYVGSNGIIAFGTSSYNPHINIVFSGTLQQYVVTPFWDDINIANGGVITYEIFDSGYFLEKVNEFIRRRRPTSFEGTWMLVASYEKVQPFTGTGENTFQAIVVSDGDYSYTIFTYKCGLMNWDNGATIGYNAGGDPYANNDPSSSDVACVNSPDSDWSNVIYQLSEDTPEDPPAEDITVSSITHNSATVSWTVPFLSSPQEYTVEYGVDEDDLNETSDTLSESDTSLTDQTYSIVLNGLTLGALYYVRVSTTNAGNVTFYSDTTSFRTTQSAPSGPPRNFVISVEKTTLHFEWDPPADDEIGGILVSYTLSCSHEGDNDFDVDLEVIEEITIDEFLPSTTYECTILATTNGGDGPTATQSATTEDTTEIYLQFLDLAALLGVDEDLVPEELDGVAGPIQIDTGFPFGDTNQTQFYVGTNGIISFGSSSYNPFSNDLFPISGRYVVAPYWDDIDIRNGNGRISYEVHESGFYLNQVSTFVARKRPSNFKGTWMAVIFYDAVRPYPSSSDSRENSFQVILITDGTYSYSVFTYNCNLTEWDDGVTIGFNGGSSFYENHDPSSSEVACLNLPDSIWTNVVYLLSSESPEIPQPNDLRISDLTTSSVTVTWTIPSFSETETYKVEYGVESGVFNLSSSTVNSVTDTTVVNQTYSVAIDALMAGTIYYMRVVAESGINDLYKRYSNVALFRTLEEEQNAYLPFLNHTDTYLSSGELDACDDDCTSDNITLPSDFPFGQYIHQNAYVGTNGWISFGRSIEGSDPELFPPTSSAYVFWTYVIAPFWANQSTLDGGIVSWEIHNNSLSPDIIDQVNTFIKEEYGDSEFNGTWMMIFFWEDVAPLEESINNTYQAILITNGTKSYAVFTYKCGELEFSDVAVIGYSAPLGPYKNHPLSDTDITADTIACVHQDSVWNNVIYDLQPDGNTVLTGTPEPYDYIGSCIEYSECCTGDDCFGIPADCYCDAVCYEYEDCCYDIDSICLNGTADEYDILVANGQYIHQVFSEGSDATTLSSDLFESVTGIDFHYDLSMMFWSDTQSDKIYQAYLNGSYTEELINSSILAVDDIAVDWISNKLYWVDAVWARIEVLDLESYYRAEVLRVGPSTLPRAIAVDPISRFMFWTDWGMVAKIEVAFMDGSDRRTIISTSLSQPNGITIDYSSKKIYWSDSDLDKIEYSNYDGTSRTTLETEASGLKYPFALTVANNSLFWSDWSTNKVYGTHKVHGSDSDNGYFQTIALFSSSPYGIEAVLFDRQQSGDNPCEASNCSHICLLNDLEDGFSCVCAEGYDILSDGRSCKKLDESELPPSEGSCIEAGYNSSDMCCVSGFCAGLPAVCMCDLECYERGDCCSDIHDSCTEGIPAIPTDVDSDDITIYSVNISWTISYVAITQERYVVKYGVNMSDLDMTSESLNSRGQTLTNQSYSVMLDNLEGDSIYYYQVVSENDFSSSSSLIYFFTTLEGVPSAAPVNFNIEVNMTTLYCSWAPPPEDTLNGNITSYTLSCLVDNELVFNENISSTEDSFEINLYSLNTTYTCSIYASTDLGDGPSSETITVTTTDDPNFLMVLPFIAISDTYNFDVVTLAETDDGGTGPILIPEEIGFPFGNSSLTSLYIGTNGLISFESFYNSFSNQEFPGSNSDRYLVAPFWDDVDIRQDNGNISYEIHDSGYYLDHVSGFIRAIAPSEFQGTWMLVAFWDAVHPFIGTSNPEENTFQAILITDGMYSYTVFTYMCGLMEWDNGATIGFNSAGGRYANNDPSSSDIACVNIPDSQWSNVIFRLSDDSPEYPSPSDVEVSEITRNTAVISWTVEYVLEQQEYSLIYGVNENSLNLTSNRILGNANTSLTNQQYSIMLTGLTMGTDYYVFAIAEYGLTTLYSDTISFRTTDNAPTGSPLNYKVIPIGTGLYFRWDDPEDPDDNIRILSYTITCYISDTIAINVTLNPVNSVILDEFMPSTTYSCSIYSTSSGGNGPPTPSVNVTTEDVVGDIYLPFLSLDALYGADQVFLDRTDDGSSGSIDVGADGFPFGNSSQTELYVNTNGLLSFGSPYTEYSNQDFPGSGDTRLLYLVAPFWDDIDISRDQIGQISYEIHQSGYYLDQVNDFLQRKRPSTFSGTWMFVAYWDSVRPFPGSSNSVVNSFQAILITDGKYSYSIFIYNCNTTEWDNDVTIGYSAAGDPYDNHDPSSSDIACLNYPDSDWTNVIYLLSDDDPEIPPPDVTEYEVGLTSINISFTVPYFLEEEEYYIIYGFNSDELYLTSDTILSVSDTSLENQTYTIRIEGLEAGTIYFAHVVAAFGVSGEFRRYSDAFVFRTKENEQTVYLEFLPHTNTSTNSGTLRSCDDCSSFQIDLPDDFPFGGYFHDSVYVSTNGLVSFGRPFTDRDPEIFPSDTSDVFWRYIAAAFWADWLTLTSGTVSWELHTALSSPSLLGDVDNLIQREYGDTNFTGSWMLVAFWENVTDDDRLFENTFQEILITNGTKSYAVYTYKCGELLWMDTASIGFNAPPDDYYNHPLTLTDFPPDEVACVHLNSVWNNVIIDLEPNPVILPLTPEPYSSIGSCETAGFTECCITGCLGFPADCFCDDLCRQLDDCCYDIDYTCPEGNATDFDILVANGIYIHQVHFEGNSSDTILTNQSGNAVGIDFHFEDSVMFWSDTENDIIYTADLNGTQAEVLVDSNIYIVEDIAVDWVSNKLYWVDAAWARIEVLDLESRYRAEVLRVGPNTNPSAIALEPQLRLMFWTDWGKTPKIEQSFMDGSGRRIIIDSDLSQPNSITVDYIKEKIYWSDSDLDKIEYAKYDGTERMSVETEDSGLLYPFALTVAGDILFWTDWVTNAMYATHKQHGAETGEGYFAQIAVFVSTPYGIEALDARRQLPANNTCELNGCSHVCIMSDTGYTCVCPDGYSLESDQLECKSDNTSDSGGAPLNGSCIDAGYTSCCTHGYCAGYPPTCSCHPECTEGAFDCCSDFAEICPSVPPLQPTNLIVSNVYSTSAQLNWTISRVTFGFETYFVRYGLSSEVLDMESDIQIVTLDSSVENATYSITIENLQPFTTYYYNIAATNVVGETVSDIDSFTTESQMTSSTMTLPESTIPSISMPITTDTEQPPQTTTTLPATSTPIAITAMQSSTGIVYTPQGTSTATFMQTGGPTYTTIFDATTPFPVPTTQLGSPSRSMAVTSTSSSTLSLFFSSSVPTTTQISSQSESATISTMSSVLITGTSPGVSITESVTSTVVAVPSIQPSETSSIPSSQQPSASAPVVPSSTFSHPASISGVVTSSLANQTQTIRTSETATTGPSDTTSSISVTATTATQAESPSVPIQTSSPSMNITTMSSSSSVPTSPGISSTESTTITSSSSSLPTPPPGVTTIASSSSSVPTPPPGVTTITSSSSSVPTPPPGVTTITSSSSSVPTPPPGVTTIASSSSSVPTPPPGVTTIASSSSSVPTPPPGVTTIASSSSSVPTPPGVTTITSSSSSVPTPPPGVTTIASSSSSVPTPPPGVTTITSSSSSVPTPPPGVTTIASSSSSVPTPPPGVTTITSSSSSVPTPPPGVTTIASSSSSVPTTSPGVTTITSSSSSVPTPPPGVTTIASSSSSVPTPPPGVTTIASSSSSVPTPPPGVTTIASSSSSLPTPPPGVTTIASSSSSLPTPPPGVTTIASSSSSLPTTPPGVSSIESTTIPSTSGSLPTTSPGVSSIESTTIPSSSSSVSTTTQITSQSESATIPTMSSAGTSPGVSITESVTSTAVAVPSIQPSETSSILSSQQPSASAPAVSSSTSSIPSGVVTSSLANQTQTMRSETATSSPSDTTSPISVTATATVQIESPSVPIQPSTTETTPTATPIESNTIRENSVKITLPQYDEKTFNSSVQQNFKMATAQAVTSYCGKASCAIANLKRETFDVESNDVTITDILGSSMGVSFQIYVMLNGDDLLDCNSLFAAIQNGSDIYSMYNFSSVTADECTIGDTRRSEKKGLSGGAVVGIIIAVLVVVAAVVVTAAFIVYRIRKKGFYRVRGLIGGYDDPMTDRFFEFDGSTADDEDDDNVKKQSVL